MTNIKRSQSGALVELTSEQAAAVQADLKVPADTVASLAALDAKIGPFHPTMWSSFEKEIAGLTPRSHEVFGTAAVAPVGGVAITNAAQLAQHYTPLMAVYDANGNIVGDTGRTRITGVETQAYADTFTRGNHIFDADGLRLQPTLDAGHNWQVDLLGQVDTVNGINVNGPNTNVPTPIAQCGIADINAVEVGDVFNSPSSLYMVWVRAKDTGAGTITVETATDNSAANWGQASNQKVNMHFSRLPVKAARVISAHTHGTTTSYTLNAPAGPGIVPGQFVAISWGYNLQVTGYAKVQSVTNGRLTINTDVSPEFGGSWDASAVGKVMVFIPPLWSGQLVGKALFAPHFAHNLNSGFASEIWYSKPAISSYFKGPLYTRAQIQAARAANPDMLLGPWDALWPYQSTQDPANPNAVKRVEGPLEFKTPEWDIREGYCHLWTSQADFSCHPFNTDKSSARIAAHGQVGDWLEAQTGGGLSSAAARTTYMRPRWSDWDGRLHCKQDIWANGRLISYFDGMPLCETTWNCTSPYGFKMIINLAMGALVDAFPSALFMPFNASDIARAHLKIHRRRTWGNFSPLP